MSTDPHPCAAVERIRFRKKLEKAKESIRRFCMTPEPKLLPCPFCGGTNLLKSLHYHTCDTCKATGPVQFKNPHAWNTRATPPLSAPVADFARKMQEALDANMHKGTREEWRKRHPVSILKDLMDKYNDVAREAENYGMASQAVNTANYCLLLADACGGLESEEEK